MIGQIRRRSGGAHGNSSIPNYLCFTALEDGTFTFSSSANVTTTQRDYVEYSIDNGASWVRATKASGTAMTLTTTTISSGSKVLWRGIGTVSANNNSFANVSQFSSTGAYDVSGNLASLFYGDDFDETSKTKGNYYAARLFYNNVGLKSAKDLICNRINNNYPYMGMFHGCSSLEESPNLTEATLTTGCYWKFFDSCSSLTYVKMLATDISASYCLYNWMSGVPNVSTSIFVKHIDATWTTTGNSGVPTGWTVIYYDPALDKYYTDQTRATECDDHGNPL